MEIKPIWEDVYVKTPENLFKYYITCAPISSSASYEREVFAGTAYSSEIYLNPIVKDYLFTNYFFPIYSASDYPYGSVVVRVYEYEEETLIAEYIFYDDWSYAENSEYDSILWCTPDYVSYASGTPLLDSSSNYITPAVNTIYNDIRIDGTPSLQYGGTTIVPSSITLTTKVGERTKILSNSNIEKSYFYREDGTQIWLWDYNLPYTESNDCELTIIYSEYDANGTRLGVYRYVFEVAPIYRKRRILIGITYSDGELNTRLTYEYNIKKDMTYVDGDILCLNRPIKNSMPNIPLTYSTKYVNSDPSTISTPTVQVALINNYTREVYLSTQLAENNILNTNLYTYDFDNSQARIQSRCGDELVFIAANTNDRVILTPFRYTINDNTSNYAFYYKNAIGGFDCLAVSGKMLKTDNLERKTITTYKNGKQEYENEYTPSYSTFTGYLTEEQSLKMHNLLNSNEVFLYDIPNRKSIPVVLTNTTTDYKTNKNQTRKLISYNITCEERKSKYRR